MCDLTPQIISPWATVPLLTRWKLMAVFGAFAELRASLHDESESLTLIWKY
jgi:hypothetical protein